MTYDGSYMMGGMHGLWWLFWLVLLGVLMFGSWGRSGDRHNQSRVTPHELLQQRLASGAIASAEYEERKSLLDRDTGSNDGKT